jgi:hypothetical protein
VPSTRTLARDVSSWRDSYAFTLPAECRIGYIALTRTDRSTAERSARLLRLDGGA